MKRTYTVVFNSVLSLLIILLALSGCGGRLEENKAEIARVELKYPLRWYWASTEDAAIEDLGYYTSDVSVEAENDDYTIMIDQVAGDEHNAYISGMVWFSEEIESQYTDEELYRMTARLMPEEIVLLNGSAELSEAEDFESFKATNVDIVLGSACEWETGLCDYYVGADGKTKDNRGRSFAVHFHTEENLNEIDNLTLAIAGLYDDVSIKKVISDKVQLVTWENQPRYQEITKYSIMDESDKEVGSMDLSMFCMTISLDSDIFTPEDAVEFIKSMKFKAKGQGNVGYGAETEISDWKTTDGQLVATVNFFAPINLDALDKIEATDYKIVSFRAA